MIEPDSNGLPEKERAAIAAFLELFGTREPSLEQIWAAMDFIWFVLGCDNRSPDPQKLARFYAHPVWLLNGLFIEQHDISMKHREEFSNWVARQKPSRVADFGGGFGTLARMIAAKCPEAQVHAIEPFAHEAARARLSASPNASFVPAPQGLYDVVLATDVFEHVLDPLSLAESISAHVRLGGQFMIANNFHPVIACHLPRTFHFRYTWPLFMRCLGYRPERRVCYGRSYLKVKTVRGPFKAKRWERMSQCLFPLLEGARWMARLARRRVPRLAPRMRKAFFPQ